MIFLFHFVKKLIDLNYDVHYFIIGDGNKIGINTSLISRVTLININK